MTATANSVARPTARHLLAAALLAATLHLPGSAAPAAPAVAMAPGAIDIALREARIGELAPVEALLARPDGGGAARPLLEAQRAAARLRDVDAAAAVARYLAGPDADPARRARAHEIAAESAFFAGRYREAAAHAARFLAAPAAADGEAIEGLRQLKTIADLLSEAPPQRLERRGNGVAATTTRDKVGLIRTTVLVGPAPAEAVIDTGANLSVASAGAAARMGLRMLGEAAVGNSLGGSVAVRLAIADTLEIAGARLRNVPFLVLDDAALSFPVPGGYRIEAIVGLPVLRALGRVRLGGDSFRVEPPAASGGGGADLRIVGSSPFVRMSAGGHAHPFYFDSGANRSVLAPRFAAEHPELGGTAKAGTEGKAGAGGAERVERHETGPLVIRLGGVDAPLSAIGVETSANAGEADRYGVLGADLLQRFGAITIDFDRMVVEVELGRTAAGR